MGNTASIQQYRCDDIHSARQLAIELDPSFESRSECSCYERLFPYYKPYYITYNETRTINLYISEKEKYKNLYIYNIDYEIPKSDIGKTMYKIQVHSPNVKMLVRVRGINGLFGDYCVIQDLLIDTKNYGGHPGISFVFISNEIIYDITISYDSDICCRGCPRGIGGGITDPRGLYYVLNYPHTNYPIPNVGSKNSYRSNQVDEYYEEFRRDLCFFPRLV